MQEEEMVHSKEKQEMVDRCLMAASLAALVCHPNATIKCFRPKSKPTPSQRKDPSLDKKHQSKSTSKNEFRANSSLSRTSTSFNMKHLASFPPTFATSRIARDSYLVSNLDEQEPSFGVMETIFRSGWDNKIGLQIEKVLKINHGEEVLNKFEEYRAIVKSKSTNISPRDRTTRIERLAVDGNEVLRFHGAIVTCSLGNDEFSTICHGENCGVCKMVYSSLSEGEESVALSNNSQQAHRKIVNECGVNKICARKAIVVCRVIAGRVARCSGKGLVHGQEGGFDSVVSLCRDESEGSEELMVLNARAVLPCFVVVYNA